MISSKNPLDRLIRPVQELAKSVIKTNSKMHKLNIYDKAVNDLINKNRWQEAIDEEF